MQSSSKKFFLAINFPCDVAKELVQLQAQLKSSFSTTAQDTKLRFVSTPNLHQTVCYIGCCSEEKYQQLIICADKILRTQSCFDLTYYKAEWFPSNNSPKVLALLHHPCDKLLQLVQDLESSACQMGFARDKKLYRGHVTLARVKNIGMIEPLSCELKTPIKANVKSITVYESQMLATGVQYSALQTFTLS